MGTDRYQRQTASAIKQDLPSPRQHNTTSTMRTYLAAAMACCLATSAFAQMPGMGGMGGMMSPMMMPMMMKGGMGEGMLPLMMMKGGMDGMGKMLPLLMMTRRYGPHGRYGRHGRTHDDGQHDVMMSVNRSTFLPVGVITSAKVD